MSRITEIRYVGYSVADLAAERDFYTEKWCLKEVATKDGLVYFATEGSEQLFVIRLRQGDDNRVDVIALAAETRDDVEALHIKVRDAGCRIIFPPKELDQFGGGYGFRFFSPDGLPFEISAEVTTGPSRQLVRWEGVPQKISHIVLHSPDHPAMVRFFVDVLGFRISDWLGDFMAFLRCNEWHHRVAILPGPPCLNHVAYDMLTVDDMMRGIGRLKQSDIDIKWGPGRHTAGNNTFSYFVTPNGFTVEYTAELDSVDFETHQAKVHVPTPQVMDQWGVGVGGPQTMPHPKPDAGLFQPAAV
jgi:catechol 2,3-dioxygenase-like lactoylglutathione lyase family enzyme